MCKWINILVEEIDSFFAELVGAVQYDVLIIFLFIKHIF